MACRGKDIPGRPNNKTKAGGGRQVGRGGKGGGRRLWTRGYEGTNKRWNDRELCIRLSLLLHLALLFNPFALGTFGFFPNGNSSFFFFFFGKYPSSMFMKIELNSEFLKICTRINIRVLYGYYQIVVQ